MKRNSFQVDLAIGSIQKKIEYFKKILKIRWNIPLKGFNISTLHATNCLFYLRMNSFTCIFYAIDLNLITSNFQNTSWWLFLNIITTTLSF